MINDLRGQNDRLSMMLKKKPISSVVQKHVIGRSNKINSIFSRVGGK
jgi:hypothetical protein